MAIGEYLVIINKVEAITEVESGIYNNPVRHELALRGFSTARGVWVELLIQCDGEPCGYDHVLVARRINPISQPGKTWDEACLPNFMEYMAFSSHGVGYAGWGSKFIDSLIRNNGGTLPFAVLEAAKLDY
jgi:hypothetical protein